MSTQFEAESSPCIILNQDSPRVDQPTLNIPEQIALLTVWESSCVLAEEYEMALAVIDEMKKIQENPTKMPQKTIELKEDFGESDEGLIFVKKNNNKPFYKKLFYWFKNLFKRN